jgi:hypothetical protein
MGHKDPSVTTDLDGNHIVDDVQRRMGEATASLFPRTPATAASGVAGGGT